ncbi:hypothetical protein B0T10DRAFT_560809 [Thelonectria olida]|uniref:Uncharacterized protein n=1 Tax=Thelonectria olida TaxID=1576542 RepID=A0A9P9APT5_9HYPO|nr:hypothetical protein B0T10DRAFT_560809 [Thelonectria olida]
MDTLNCFGQKPRRAPPSKEESDDVFPVYSSDDNSIYRKIMITWTLRFDDVLDPDMLYGSLTRLLSTGSWRKLGGRLRLNSEGKLELHVPKEFTPERPAVRFSRQPIDTLIDQHPLAGQLPKATDNEPSMHLGPMTFRRFNARPDAPACLDDLLHSDEPQLSVHVTSFKNATLVALAWPHTMTGAIGLAALMNAWSLTLAGRGDEVSQLQGVWEDLLGEAETRSDPDQEPYLLASKEVKGLRLLRFGLNYWWKTVRAPKREHRVFYLPASFISQLHQRALDDLKKSSGESPFISEGDVLCAWATRIVAKQRGKRRPILTLNIFDIQSRLKSVFKPEPAYVQNTSFRALSFFSAKEASDATFGETAYKFREAIAQQSTEQQILAQLRFSRAAEKAGRPLVFGEPNESLLLITNWTKANFYNVIDFAPAVVDSGACAEKRPVPKGKISFHHSETPAQNPTGNNVFGILGKDHKGNYWVCSSFLADSWAELEEEIKQSS